MNKPLYRLTPRNAEEKQRLLHNTGLAYFHVYGEITTQMTFKPAGQGTQRVHVFEWSDIIENAVKEHMVKDRAKFLHQTETEIRGRFAMGSLTCGIPIHEMSLEQLPAENLTSIVRAAEIGEALPEVEQKLQQWTGQPEEDELRFFRDTLIEQLAKTTLCMAAGHKFQQLEAVSGKFIRVCERCGYTEDAQ